MVWAAGEVGRPFRWGTTDCSSLARRALEQCFGVDVVTLKTWTTPRRAAAVLRQVGSPSAFLCERLKAFPKPLAFGQAGDIVVVPNADEPLGKETLGVLLDGGFVLFSSRTAPTYMVKHPVLHADATVYSVWEVEATHG